MIREFLEERKRRRYMEAVEEINNDIFQSNQRKLLAIKVASEFSDIKELESIIEQAQEAIDYFTTLHNENIERFEELKKGQLTAKNGRVVEFKEG